MRWHLATILAAVVAASATSFALAQANQPEATASGVSNAKIYRSVKVIRARARVINIRVKRIDARVRRIRNDTKRLRSTDFKICRLDPVTGELQCN